MNLLRYTDPDFAVRRADLCAQSSLFDADIEDRVREIIEAVRLRGDSALVEMTKRFDGATLLPEQLAISRAEILKAAVTVSDELRAAIGLALKNIQKFSRKGLRKNWTTRNVQGASVGEKYDPFHRVGIYVPGGTAPLVSTALMTVGLAKAAGCREIVVCTPCDREGRVNSALLYAASSAGATEIYRVGGAQAIAAMALGTCVIRWVQKLFGPGNAYVVGAKRLLFGHVAVDLLPGPSEVLVLADDSASPEFVAADLLAQAEHGSGHERVWLITNSKRLMRGVELEIRRQLPKRNRAKYISEALNNSGWMILVESLNAAIKLTNQLAPEHCEIMTRAPSKTALRITTAGAIFIGPWSPTALGDYVAGPSHTLPTGGAGASFAGLTVDQFQRRTSVVQYDKTALRNSLSAIQQFVRAEGLEAHGESVSVRLRKK